jgi:hypothetical protein
MIMNVECQDVSDELPDQTGGQMVGMKVEVVGAHLAIAIEKNGNSSYIHHDWMKF